MGQFYADRVAVGSHRARTPEGYLVVTGVPIARTGWQTYRASELRLPGDGDRLVKLYRDASEVFSPETIASFEGKSITSEHPPVFLTQENDAGYSKGHIQNIRKGGVLEDGNTGLLADLVIKDAMSIQQIETDAKSEVSCGYEYDTEPYGASPDKFRMTFIRGNHLAVVKRGRAGSSVRILDSQPDDLVQEGGTDVSDEKFSLTDVVRAVGIALGIKSQQVTDSDPGAVERNRESMEAAREKRDRTMDAEKKEEKPVEEEKPKTAEVGDSKASDKKSEDKENPPVAEEKKRQRRTGEGREGRKRARHSARLQRQEGQGCGQGRRKVQV